MAIVKRNKVDSVIWHGSTMQLQGCGFSHVLQAYMSATDYILHKDLRRLVNVRGINIYACLRG